MVVGVFLVWFSWHRSIIRSLHAKPGILRAWTRRQPTTDNAPMIATGKPA
jgi:hypothetical protein